MLGICWLPAKQKIDSFFLKYIPICTKCTDDIETFPKCLCFSFFPFGIIKAPWFMVWLFTIIITLQNYTCKLYFKTFKYTNHFVYRTNCSTGLQVYSVHVVYIYHKWHDRNMEDNKMLQISQQMTCICMTINKYIIGQYMDIQEYWSKTFLLQFFKDHNILWYIQILDWENIRCIIKIKANFVDLVLTVKGRTVQKPLQYTN